MFTKFKIIFLALMLCLNSQSFTVNPEIGNNIITGTASLVISCIAQNYRVEKNKDPFADKDHLRSTTAAITLGLSGLVAYYNSTGLKSFIINIIAAGIGTGIGVNIPTYNFEDN